MYMDIIRPQTVEDVLSSFFRMMNVTGEDDDMALVHYDWSRYLPVIRKIIDILEIFIKAKKSELVPPECRRPLMELHFGQKHLL